MSEFENIDLSEDVLTRVREFLSKGFINAIKTEEREEGDIITSIAKIKAENEPILFTINVRNEIQRDLGLPNSEAEKISDLLLNELNLKEA